VLYSREFGNVRDNGPEMLIAHSPNAEAPTQSVLHSIRAASGTVSAMPMPEQVTWKLYRAKQHYDELTKELVEYFRNGPGELVEAAESAPENQILGYKLKGDVPARFGLIAGDFLQNMRSSLDYLVWQLVIANKRKPGTCNAFPICLTLQGWKSLSINTTACAEFIRMRLRK
jgi:hypothetical protein